MTSGGWRPNSGRKLGAEAPRTHVARVPLSPAELAELLAAAGDVPLAEFLRSAGLERARR